MIRIGTSYFVSVATARRYYADYGFTRGQVLRKVEIGEIRLGRPDTEPGQKIEIIDNGTRYAIVEG